jgi:hypothetical protein
MKDLIVVTVLYNYPTFALPIFYNRALQYFEPTDIHTFRFESFNDEEYIKFSNGENDYYSKLFFYKTVKLVRELRNIQNESEHILFLDALDTAIIKDKNTILERFKSFDCDIVLGAEKGLWPVTEFTDQYNKIPSSHETKYLNSGTYIGKTYKVIEALNKIVTFGREKVLEDQGAWTRLFLSNEMNIKIDYDRKLFFSTHESKEKLIIENGEFKGFLDTDPCVIHDNGPYNDQLTFKLAEYYKIG